MVAQEIILAMGLIFNFFQVSSFISVTVAAPSFNPDALPAVTVPSFLKTGLSELIFSSVEPCLGNSSFLKSMVSFFCVTGTFKISLSNLFFF